MCDMQRRLIRVEYTDNAGCVIGCGLVMIRQKSVVTVVSVARFDE